MFMMIIIMKNQCGRFIQNVKYSTTKIHYILEDMNEKLNSPRNDKKLINFIERPKASLS